MGVLLNIKGAQGVQGIQGDPGAVGPAGLTWQGAYVALTAYAVDDAVSYAGSTYFCIQAGTGHRPDTSPLYWAVMALVGTQGVQGVQGDQGIQGVPGDPGSDGTNGSTWFHGTAAPPANTIGVDGDFYLNTSTFDVYVKAAGTWA
jgi:hypothetical protein